MPALRLGMAPAPAGFPSACRCCARPCHPNNRLPRGTRALGNGVLDYSPGALGNLNENFLNEFEGMCGPGFPIDWNGNGTLEDDVSVDLNNDGVLTLHRDFDDWFNVVLDNLSSGDLTTPEIVTCQEVPEE